jgi:RNA polymerase sigma factor (sigma-70 family)
MAHATASTIVRQIESLFDGGSVAGLTDRQLLERFTARRDEAGDAAFVALVTRYGPMVLHVCRPLVGDRHHAEDAFQAVFLVLARNARSIRDPDLLGAWLYGVAIRTARKARARLDRLRRHEESEATRRLRPDLRFVVEPTVQPVEESAIAREQVQLLHDEIERLPRPFRLPVILCYFEGLTLDEAARRLNWPAGTLRSRLARAREKLRRALTRRGIALSTTALAAALSPRSSSASVVPHLCDSTARAAMSFAARQAVGSTASTLAKEVLRTMTIHKLWTAIVTVGFLAALAGGGYLARSIAMSEEPRMVPAAVQAPAVARHDDAAQKPSPGRMFVVGSVLDPRGRPVPNATVAISLRRKLLFAVLGSEGGLPAPVSDGASDTSGRFRLDAARASSADHASFDATAYAPGYGIGWAHLDPDEDQPSAEIRLMPEQIIEGRLFDVQGQPVPGAVVSVSGILRELPPAVLGQGRVIEPDSDGTYRWWGRIHDGPGWPKPATTDAEGRFTLYGIGRGVHARLSILDPRFAPQTIEIVTDAPAGVKTLKAALLPARTITGRVTYADTGRPAAHAEVHVAGRGGQGAITYIADRMAQTDADGRFRLSALPGDRLDAWAAAPGWAALPPRRPLPPMAPGGDRAGRRSGASARRPDSRQGHRRRHRPARRGCHGEFPAVSPAIAARRRRRLGLDESRRLVRVRRRSLSWPPFRSGARRRLPAPSDRHNAVDRGPGGRPAIVCACLPPLRPEARRGQLGSPDHAPARGDGPIPADRAGWRAGPGRPGLQPGRPRAVGHVRGPDVSGSLERSRASWPLRGPRTRP